MHLKAKLETLAMYKHPSLFAGVSSKKKRFKHFYQLEFDLSTEDFSIPGKGDDHNL
jgi:hypothetical protein